MATVTRPPTQTQPPTTQRAPRAPDWRRDRFTLPDEAADLNGLRPLQNRFTKSEQLEMLAMLIRPEHIHKGSTASHGAPYASSDYVTWMLGQIFTPAGWSMTILDGPRLVMVNDRQAFYETTIRLDVTFADGERAHRDDVGVWPLVASKDETLAETSPERYETARKSAVSDGLKACAERLGLAFRPLVDRDFALFAQQRQEMILTANRPILDAAGISPKSAVEAVAALYEL